MAGLSALSQEADTYLRALAEREFAHASGRSPGLGLEELVHRHGVLARPETFHALREQAARGGDEARRAERLQALVARTLLRARAAPHEEAIHALERDGQVETVDEILPLGEALARAFREPERARRDALGRAADRFLLAHTEPFARRLEVARAVAQSLGFSTPLELHEHLTRVKLSERSAEADQMLRQTEDAYRDLLGYVLRRADPRLRPLPSGDAQRSDLAFAAGAPQLLGLFRTEPFLRALSRWLEEWGLHPTAEGRLRVDADERPGKRARPQVSVIRAPEEVRVSLRPGTQAQDATRILRALGRGLSYAHVSGMLPPEERRLADGAVDEAYALVFAHLLTDAGWLQRYVELPAPQAREAARHFAFDALRRLRQTAAMLGHGLELHTRGPSRERAEGYVERLRAALFVDVSPGRALYDVSPDLPEPAALGGYALEHTLFEQLRARFNEDFWRNPAAGSWLLTRFREGRREDAPELAARLGLGPPTLAAAGMRLCAVMAG